MGTNEEQYKIVFTNDSVIEMKSINDYISKNLYNPQAAKRLMRKMEETIYGLKSMPRKFTIIKKFDELKLEYRRIIVNNYAVIYTIDEKTKTVYIVHTYYGGSNYLNCL